MRVDIHFFTFILCNFSPSSVEIILLEYTNEEEYLEVSELKKISNKLD